MDRKLNKTGTEVAEDIMDVAIVNGDREWFESHKLVEVLCEE